MKHRQVTIVFALSLALLGATPLAGLAKGTPRIPKSLGSASDCGQCHKDIYRMWRKSAHSNSLEDGIFQDAYRETVSHEGKEVARFCLDCHAPLAAVARDPDLRQRTTWEGVSCDVCHSIVSVERSPTGIRQNLQIGTIKRGPIPDASSPAHDIASSDLYTSSLICAGCHEFTNAESVPILTTYSEWKDSAAAREGKSCQDCHMGRTAANIVDPQVARLAAVPVNLHEVPGGHSLDQLHKALRVSIDPERNGDTLRVTVKLVNKGAGHSVPTGMPGRRVIMEVSVRGSNGAEFQERRIYGKQFTDAAGEVISRDSRYFAKGIRFLSDSRIPADSERLESFDFAIPARSTAYITVKLHYEHLPTGDKENRTFLTFLSETRTVGP